MSGTTGGTATAQPRQKVLAAAGGSGVASALSVLIIWGLKSAGLNIESTIQEAFSTVLISVVTFAAGYYTPPGSSETTIINSAGNAQSATK